MTTRRSAENAHFGSRITIFRCQHSHHSYCPLSVLQWSNLTLYQIRTYRQAVFQYKGCSANAVDVFCYLRTTHHMCQPDITTTGNNQHCKTTIFFLRRCVHFNIRIGYHKLSFVGNAVGHVQPFAVGEFPWFPQWNDLLCRACQ